MWLKGINTADDARRAVDLGVDVVYVSNHGGRQLDHSRGCIDALPEVAAAVDRRVPIVVDGGFMRGTDIIKALARGATAVGVGRLEALAMAAGGAAAVTRALELLEVEIRTNMALLGVRSVEELNPCVARTGDRRSSRRTCCRRFRCWMKGTEQRWRKFGRGS